jgi:hypothetical protein
VSLPGDIQRYLFIGLAAVLAVAGLFVVSGALGGGSPDGGVPSAQQTLQKAFSAAPQKKGGRIHGSMTVNVSGPEAAAAGLSQPFKMSIDGVANPPRGGQAPAFDIGVQVDGGGESHSVHAISTGKRGYVDLDGRAYELPRSQLRRFSSQQGDAGQAASLKALGIDPGSWVTNVTDAGTASVGAEQTNHVTADIDVPRMMEDVTKAAETTGQGQQVPAEAKDAIRKAVKSAKLEVFASKADGSLRRVVATAAFEAPGPQGKNLAGDVRFELQVSNVGKAQKIVAPRNALPFSRLDQSSLGLDGLGALGAASGRTARSAPAPRGEDSGAPARKARQSRQAANQAYVACVQKALDVTALSKCQQLLP